MPGSQRLYIIGFMGSGKTTVGKKLASLLDWSFIDLDKRIEEQSGKTIPEIFTQYGEPWFRNQESIVLKSLDSLSNIVISTGGGTPCHSDNMDYMIETGLTLYLKLTPGQLKSRLSDAMSERPLIKDLDKENLLDFINEKLNHREQWYNRAEILFEGFDPNLNLLHSIIKSKLKI
jgi:shikimate kinase